MHLPSICLHRNDAKVPVSGQSISPTTAHRIPCCIYCDTSRGLRVVRQFRHSGQNAQLAIPRAPINARYAQEAQVYQSPAMPTTVPLLRVETPNGRQHMVITSLLAAGAPTRRLKPRLREIAVNLQTSVPGRSNRPMVDTPYKGCRPIVPTSPARYSAEPTRTRSLCV